MRYVSYATAKAVRERAVPDLIMPYVVHTFADMDKWDIMLAMEMDYVCEN